MSTRYAVAIHRVKDAERSQDPNDQLSWAGNEMASIIRDGDSSLVELPVAWAGLAMVHKAQHEIAAGFETEQHELVEVEERAISILKQVICCFIFMHLIGELLPCTLCCVRYTAYLKCHHVS